MTTDERLDSIARSLDTLTKVHLDSDREYRERFQQLTDLHEKNAREIQELRVAVQDLKFLVQQDGENIRALARIAEIHNHRLDRLEE